MSAGCHTGETEWKRKWKGQIEEIEGRKGGEKGDKVRRRREIRVMR